jgi:hypothetical protein
VLTETSSKAMSEADGGRGDSGFMRIIRFASDGNAYVETFSPAMDAIPEADIEFRNARGPVPKLTSAYTYDPDDSGDFLDELTVSNLSFSYEDYLSGSGTPPPDPIDPEPSTECPDFNKTIINQARVYPFSVGRISSNTSCPADGQTAISYNYQKIFAANALVEYKNFGNLSVSYLSPTTLRIREVRRTVYRINFIFFWIEIMDFTNIIDHPSLSVTEAQAASCVAYYSQLVAGCP